MSTNWTTYNMPNLSGKVVIVTGANSGIGFDAALECARKGAQVVLACRSMDKATQALATLKQEIPNAQAEIIHLDLASQQSVHQFAEEFQAKYQRLDALLNNAGIMMVPYGKTEDGFERQLGTNHLGHFALTGLLIDLLLVTPNARVINVSSSGHTMGNMDFDNLMFDDGKDYSPTSSYGRSKLANLLFTYELQRRFTALGSNTTALAAHPGMSNTNLGNHLGDEAWYWRFLFPIMSLVTQSSAMGALPSIRAAVDPQAKGGQYYGPKGIMEMRGYPVIVKSNEQSHNEADAKKLWDVSQELTGITYLELELA